MENDHALKLYRDGKHGSLQTSNLYLDPISLENFTVLKKNKLILVPILVGIIIEIVLDLILIPVFKEVILFEEDPLFFLTVFKMLILRVLIPVWFLKTLQNTITKTNIDSIEDQNPPKFDSLFQSLRDSLIHIPRILIIHFLIVSFGLVLFLLSNLPEGDGISIENPFLIILLIIIVILAIIAMIFIEIYLIAVYVHWMILTVLNENRLEQSFKDSLLYTRKNFKKIVKLGMIPILMAIGVSIVVEINKILWINSLIMILGYYCAIFFIVLVFGGNYLKDHL